MTDQTRPTLGAMETSRKSGEEFFHQSGKPLDLSLLDFWQWSGSNLIDNTQRGILAEYIVATSLGVVDGIRREWDACDLKMPEGIRIEVKSGAYIQSWHQKGFSKITFGIGPSLGWDAETNEYASEKKRNSDVYVFCVLASKDQATIDPLDLDQWEFYVLSTKVLDEKAGLQKTIGLAGLKNLGAQQATFSTLKEVICGAGEHQI